MIDLNNAQVSKLSERLPNFELSYETISHTKVSTSYNVVTAIPTGKKVMLWFTFYQNKDVCYFFELNKEKRISKGKLLNNTFDSSLSLGTILYGSCILDDENEIKAIVIDDILYYEGVLLSNTNIIHKLSMLRKTFSKITRQDTMIPIYSCVFWEININDDVNEYPNTISSDVFDTIPYNIHHIQYRSAYEKKPFINVFMNKKLNVVSLPTRPKQNNNPLLQYCLIPFKMNLHKPQYRYPTIFQVMADIQFDIYHLFAFGKQNKKEYYDVAYIPNYDISVKMNSIFRTVKENINIDNIEESDDEDDFQNIDPFKYVNTNIEVPMYFQYNKRFKKWVPLGIAPSHMKIIHIGRLVFYQ